MPVVIDVRGIGKRYRLLGLHGAYRNFRESIVQAITRPFSRSSKSSANEFFWALRDVSFAVDEGEVLGLIGRNGAGKSTLLKILSRITVPTEGRALLYGRTGSLLEVGTGFHPELTGRENIDLSGTVLGMRRSEIAARLDEIVEFSELERFLDTPVKHYSNGMYVRLAFAVAAHLDPEILFIDEVLAVGDADFQKKCLGKMGEVARGGRTVVFVSHNMGAIQRLCHRCILLEEGRLIADGPPADVVAQYLGGPHGEHLEWRRTTPPQSPAHLTRVALCDPTGTVLTYVTTATPLTVRVEFEIERPLRDLTLTVALMDYHGDQIFGTEPEDAGLCTPSAPGIYGADVRFPEELFLARGYRVMAVLWTRGEGNLDRVEELSFVAQAGDSFGVRNPGGRVGYLALRCGWAVDWEE